MSYINNSKVITIVLLVGYLLIGLTPARGQNILMLSEYLQTYTSEVIIEGSGNNARVQIFENGDLGDQCNQRKLLAEGHWIGSGSCANVFALSIFDRVSHAGSAVVALKVVDDLDDFGGEVRGLRFQQQIMQEYAVNFGTFGGMLRRNDDPSGAHDFIIMDLGIYDMEKVPLYQPFFNFFHSRVLYDVNEILARIQDVEQNPIMMETPYGDVEPHVLGDIELDNFIVKIGTPPFDPILRIMASDLGETPQGNFRRTGVDDFVSALRMRFEVDIDDVNPSAIHITNIRPLP